MFERVLIATDGSRIVDEAINYAASVFLYSEFHLLCVKRKSQRGTQLTTMYQKMLEESAQKAVEHGRKLLENNGIEAALCEVRDGKPSIKILKHIKAHRIDFVILMTRTHEVSGVESFVLGSTSENVLKKVKVPVLFLNPLTTPEEKIIKRVLVATDGTTTSKNAENYALMVADHFGAALTAVSAIEDGWGKPESEAQRIVDNLAWKAQQFGVSMEKEILKGQSAAKLIAERAADFDLLIIGAGRPSFLNRVKIGHNALEIINTARRPVLVVRGY